MDMEVYFPGNKRVYAATRASSSRPTSRCRIGGDGSAPGSL